MLPPMTTAPATIATPAASIGCAATQSQNVAPKPAPPAGTPVWMIFLVPVGAGTTPLPGIPGSSPGTSGVGGGNAKLRLVFGAGSTIGSAAKPVFSGAGYCDGQLYLSTAGSKSWSQTMSD